MAGERLVDDEQLVLDALRTLGHRRQYSSTLPTVARLAGLDQYHAGRAIGSLRRRDAVFVFHRYGSEEANYWLRSAWEHSGGPPMVGAQPLTDDELPF